MLEFTPGGMVLILLSGNRKSMEARRGPELLYFIPIMFFKTAEHYLGNQDNSQIFFNFKFNVVKNFDFYLPVFIDELGTSACIQPDTEP